MKPRFRSAWHCIVALSVSAPCIVAAAEPAVIELSAPQTTGGKPLMQALADRRSTREFGTTALPPQVLANLLWAGFGINRPDSGRRTAPSAMNLQEIDIYVCMANGVFLHDARANRLQWVAARDIRAETGGQDFVKTASVALLFVADMSRLEKVKPEDRERYAWMDTGSISQNIYLFCASEGLATVVHELDRAKLAESLKLKPEQKIILAQSVGSLGSPKP